jgi:hypothetical protein
VKADAPLEVKLMKDVDDEDGGLYDTKHNFFRAPMIAIHPASIGERPEGVTPSHCVWAIFDNTIVETHLSEEMIGTMMEVRNGKGLPTFLSYDKPFTMPNGEPFNDI